MTTQFTRRTLALGAVAAATTPTAALSSVPDPVFAAIARHREAYRAHGQALAITSELDSVELEAAATHAGDVELQAALALLDTRPTTIAGCIALLRYSFQQDDIANYWPNWQYQQEPGGDDREWMSGAKAICNNIAAALEQISHRTG